jgi:hypothetical protein
MLIKQPNKTENISSRILTRARDYGLANPKGPTFDRHFNKQRTEQELAVAQNLVGQGKAQLSYPDGISPDGYSAFSPGIGLNSANVDPNRIFQTAAENQVHLFWKKNRERYLKYYRVAGRAEINEALDNICDESIYRDDLGEICSLKIDPDAEIGESVKAKLLKTFRREVFKRIMNFEKEGWNLMRTLLIEGRMFLEVVYNEEKHKVEGVNLLPSQNIIIIVQDGIILGYRQMLEGTFTSGGNTGGKNFIDFSPNQILYVDLGLFGPGGINDPRSPIEPAVKPFNQLNAIEDAVTMYRIQWGSEKMMFKIDTGMMPKPKAEKHMKDQAKLLSRRIDYNTGTGEITNMGKVIGLGEHFFISTNAGSQGSDIKRLEGGSNISKIDDLKYFKRNVVNAMKVPPGRVTALAGDGENYANGKLGEVTQAEVSFARMVQRYQIPMDILLTRLFIMVLNTMGEISDDIKIEDNFSIRFKKANAFQNYMDAEILNTNLGTFKDMMSHVKTAEQPGGVLSKRYALTKGLRLSDDEIIRNNLWIKEEARMEDEEEEGASGEDGGLGDIDELEL